MSKVITSSKDILGDGQCQLHREPVHIDALDASIWVRELTFAEQLELADRQDREKAGDTVLPFPLLVVKMCTQTPDGQTLFSDDDIKALQHKSGKALMELANAVLRLNRLDTEGQAEIEKNLEAPQPDDLRTA